MREVDIKKYIKVEKVPGGQLEDSRVLKGVMFNKDVVYQWPYEAAALAFEAIPRTLAQNCGLNVIRTMTQLQGKVMVPYLLQAPLMFS
jgi:chaperonin GroEL (HSP60 family)